MMLFKPVLCHFQGWSLVHLREEAGVVSEVLTAPLPPRPWLVLQVLVGEEAPLVEQVLVRWAGATLL